MKFNFKKKYGQNFLQDKSIIKNIVSSINPLNGDLVIEIGPGSGALTKELIKTNAYILAYEIDHDLKSNLEPLESDKCKIIFDDFLKRNVFADINEIEYNNLYIIGNLPYYITTPIITKIIDEELLPKEMVFMVQKEVAERFSASVGTREYGSITVFLNYFFDVSVLFHVNKNKFYPIPNVDSSVIKMVRKEENTKVDLLLFNKFVRDSFTFKRKNLRNNLKSYNQEKIKDILEKRSLSLDNRAEDMSYQDFVFLTNEYYK